MHYYISQDSLKEHKEYNKCVFIEKGQFKKTHSHEVVWIAQQCVAETSIQLGHNRLAISAVPVWS